MFYRKVVIHTYNGNYKYVGACDAEKTLKDVSSVGNIVIASGQVWDGPAKSKYMSNSITSVIVSCYLYTNT